MQSNMIVHKCDYRMAINVDKDLLLNKNVNVLRLNVLFLIETNEIGNILAQIMKNGHFYILKVLNMRMMK